MLEMGQGETVLRLRGGGCFSWFEEIRGKKHDEEFSGHTPILSQNTHEPSETTNQKERPKFKKHKTKIKGGNSPRIKAKDKSQTPVTPVRRSRFNFDQEIKSNNGITATTIPFQTISPPTGTGATTTTGDVVVAGSALGLGLGTSVDPIAVRHGSIIYENSESDARRGEKKAVVGYTV